MISKLTPKTIILVFIFFLILGFINQNYSKTNKQKTNEIPTIQNISQHDR